MLRPSWKFLLIGAVVAVTWTASAPQADAFGGCGRGCYGTYWGYAPTYAYSSWCTTGCDPCGSWYLGWRPRPIRRALLNPYRWHNAGWGSCGYSCGYTCWRGCCGWDACSSCGVSYGGCCSDAAGTVTVDTSPSPTPAEMPADDVLPGESPPAMPSDEVPSAMPEAPAEVPPPTEPGTTGVPTPADSGLLTIWVPADAKVTINGMNTRSAGSRRQYVSYGLKPGFNYQYEVRAQVVRNGQLIEDVRSVTLTAGQREAVAFGFNVGANGTLASGG